MKWRDVTTYSQSAVIIIPKIWELKLTFVTIAIHRHIDYMPDVWLATCDKLGMSNILLKNTDIRLAQIEALAGINLWIDRISQDIKTVLKGEQTT